VVQQQKYLMTSKTQFNFNNYCKSQIKLKEEKKNREGMTRFFAAIIVKQ